MIGEILRFAVFFLVGGLIADSWLKGRRIRQLEVQVLVLEVRWRTRDYVFPEPISAETHHHSGPPA